MSREQGMCKHGSLPGSCESCKENSINIERRKNRIAFEEEALDVEKETKLEETEIEQKFQQYLNGKEYTTRKKLEDENGIYMWEIEIKNDDGTTTEYTYSKKGKWVNQSRQKTAIHITNFDETGFPLGGKSLALFICGEWKATP